MKEIVSKKYKEIFGEGEAFVVRSPGRINIIGEHTDYNEGFVLPAAIDKGIYVAMGKRNDDEIHLFAEAFDEHFKIDLHAIKKTDKDWANYVIGVVNELQKMKCTVGGFNAVIDGDLPMGAGMSSSAAVECAIAFGLNELYNLQIQKLDIPFIAQKAEHNFAGVKCGIMDMFASVMGKKNHVIKLDCKTLAYEYFPLKLDGYSIVLFNTNVKHSLASSAYNKRREECEAAVKLVQAQHIKVNSLRDVTEEMLDEYVLPIDNVIHKRSRYVVREIDRLQTACIDLQNGNLISLGQKMYATHDGLSKDYEASCTELDFLVDAVRENKNVIGARMMGGGFGGCTINIIANDFVTEVINEICIKYETEIKLPFTAYVMRTADGTCILS